MRLRDDVRKLNEFKKAVAEIFTLLKITVPGAPGSPAENIEVYVNELLAMLKRVGPICEEDDAIIRDCVNTVWKNKK
jgi:hypothetical protein